MPNANELILQSLRLDELITQARNAAMVVRSAKNDLCLAERAILDWGKEQFRQALAERGISKGTLVEMQLQWKGGAKNVFFDGICRVDPPTMSKDELPPNTSSTRTMWVARVWWRSALKNGKPGKTYGTKDICESTLEGLAEKIRPAP